MRPFAAHSALNTSFCISLTLGSILASSPANASVSIAITRQDTGNIFGSLPAYQYDGAGNLLGPIGPQGNSSFIQDIAYDSATGDLWALITNPNDASAATIANLTQNTSFAAGVDVFANKGGNIAVFNGALAAITRQDTGNIFGSLPAYQYDSAGNLLGPIGPQGDSSFIQDIAYDSATGDLWALIANANDASAATIANLTQNTSFAAGVDVFANKGGNIAVFSPGVVIPEPTSVIVWSMLAVFAGIVASYRRKGRCGSLSTV